MYELQRATDNRFPSGPVTLTVFVALALAKPTGRRMKQT